MGTFMKEDDIFITGLLELMNIRFGASQDETDEEYYGGIKELAALQDEFKIFTRDRSFGACVALLNLGGLKNARAKNRWLKLINDLPAYQTNRSGNGNEAIMDALIRNFESGSPKPVYFKAHDSRVDGQLVKITEEDQSVFYMDQPHVVISLPMKPRLKERK